MSIELSKLIKNEAERFNGFCYINKPYSCMVSEAIPQFRGKFIGKYEVDRLDDRTIIRIKPPKGSGKRKDYSIMLWPV